MTGNAATIVVRFPIVACIPIAADILRARPGCHVEHHFRYRGDYRSAAVTSVAWRFDFGLCEHARLERSLRSIMVPRPMGQRYALQQEDACQRHDDHSQKPHSASERYRAINRPKPFALFK